MTTSRMMSSNVIGIGSSGPGLSRSDARVGTPASRTPQVTARYGAPCARPPKSPLPPRRKHAGFHMGNPYSRAFIAARYSTSCAVIRAAHVYSGRMRRRHCQRPRRSFSACRHPFGARFATPALGFDAARGDIGDQRAQRADGVQAVATSPTGLAAAASGTKARVKPSLAASFSRAGGLRHGPDRARQRHFAEIHRVGRQRRDWPATTPGRRRRRYRRPAP